ncbi:hypothetical protein FLONG3_5482 [Fusarium longipes]|uniref:DUF7514 domain-containing protein n=1 Tax=Fusarium longipes TaxID=694270 RepID=A0A395SUC7_9HYPO|nr:hypothetical protein FLONG3_5482 [Fusarium longipes]
MLAEPSPSPIAALAMNGGTPVGRVHKAETSNIQIPQNKTVTKDDESIASGSTSSTDSHMKKRLSADMSKEQVEDLVMKLTIGEMKSKWFDEIFEKVKSELVEEHSPANSTPSSSEPSSPKSNPVNPTPSQQSTPQEPVRENERKPKQSTSPVESKSRSNETMSSSRSSLNATSSPSTSFVSDSTSSNHQQPSRPKSAPLQTSPPASKARPSVRFSNSPIILNEDPEPRHTVPPRPASRSAIPSESSKQGPTLSAVDLKWGRLFDDRGDPTPRLGQVLRGIANYLIVEYSPRNSLVVTPEKLKAFYHEYKLDAETFPFQQIFDCRPHGALDNLETLYQHLRCENHLVQRRPGGMPHIPSLTPAGFERWMACQIQAFPDQEAKRLNHIIADLPIIADGAFEDGKPERLPKQLSRYLLPAARHRETYDIVVDAITGWIKHTEENEADVRRTSSEDVYKSTSKDDKAGRYRPDDYRDRDTKYRRGSKDNHKPPLSRSDPSHRFVPRASSDNIVRPSKESSPMPTGSSHRARSPVSNRYRHSNPTVDAGASTADNYDLPSPGHRNSYPSGGSSRRGRDKEYRYSSGRDSKPPVEAIPRTVPRRDADRRSSLIFEETGKDPNGMTYDEYLRLNPRPMRNAVVDDGGHYRNPYSSGSDERAR